MTTTSSPAVDIKSSLISFSGENLRVLPANVSPTCLCSRRLCGLTIVYSSYRHIFDITYADTDISDQTDCDSRVQPLCLCGFCGFVYTLSSLCISFLFSLWSFCISFCSKDLLINPRLNSEMMCFEVQIILNQVSSRKRSSCPIKFLFSCILRRFDVMKMLLARHSRYLNEYVLH